MGCSNRIVKCFESYLSVLRQSVVINRQSSDWVQILPNVPQGSILNPLLFLIYINNIVRKTLNFQSSCLPMTQVVYLLDCPLQSTQLLNIDLQTISDWAAACLVTFNPQTLSILISHMRNPVFHPPIFINGTMIKTTSFNKHMGLTFSNTGWLDERVKSISEISWSRLNL